MLEQLRRNSRSFIIWILFGIIIAVFIVSFGPQANPDSLGCGHGPEFALEVGEQDVSLNSWRFAMNGLKGGGGGQDSGIRRQRAFDLLVERELLAQEAEDRGFRVPDDLVNKAISAGEFFILGHRIKIDDKNFFRDYRQLESFASSLGLPSVAELVEQQRREHLAEMTRHLFLASGAVSDEEVKQVYLQDNTKVTVDYVKFDVAAYKNKLTLGEQDIASFASSKEQELVKAWEAEKTQWSNDRARILARHIFIAKDTPAPEPEAAEEPKPEEEALDEEAQKKADEAKAAAAAKKADEARARAASAAKEEATAVHARLTGGADFAAVAREVSDDPLTKSRGGVLGWRPAESLGYGKEVVEAAKKLEIGVLSQPIETPRGFHIIRVDEKSDKGLTYEQKKLDLAAKLATDHYARELAKKDAEQALAQARAKKLEDVFERKARPSQPFAPGQLPDNLPPEILEQLQQMQIETGTGDQGTIYKEGPNVLAQDGAQPEPAKPAATPAKPAATPAKPAATPAKPAATPAADKPATTPGAAEPKPKTMTSGGDGLPVVTVDRPGLESIGPVSRTKDFLAGVGKSEELLNDLFDTLEVGALADKVYQVSGTSDAFVIVQLKDREDADMKKFDEAKSDLKTELAYEKGVKRLSSWLMDRCQAAAKDGEVKINRTLLEDEDDPSKRSEYTPCASFNEMSVAGQLRGRETP
jgi:peptidyl-prolyl cis-trans isomerase D